MAGSTPSLPTNLDELYLGETPETGDRQIEHITTNVQPLSNGDTFYVPVGGGAGYGDVLERDPKSVIVDLKNDMLNHWTAQNLYCVVYDEDSLRLDEKATEIKRQEAREERKKRGMSYDDFMVEWSKLKPADSVLAYYGNYPDPAAV